MLLAASRALSLCAACILLAVSCTTSRFYTPNTMQIPMLTGAQEATITGGVSKSGKSSAWEAQAIYSPLPHVGVMVNHFDLRYEGATQTDNTPFSFYESEFKGKTRLTEGGIGGYYQLGQNKEYLMSLFGGFGQGSTENKYFPPPDIQTQETFDSDWRYQRWFVQPALAMKYHRFQVGTALRFVWVNYLDGNVNTRVGILETERIQLLESSSPLFLTEMAWSIGWRFRPMTLSLNSTAVVRGKDSIRELDLASNYVSLTVGLNLHEIGKKK